MTTTAMLDKTALAYVKTEWPQMPEAILAEIIDDYLSHVSRSVGEVEEAREAAALAVIMPFAEAADDLDEAHKDGSDIWESPAAMNVTAGHLRSARALTAAWPHMPVPAGWVLVPKEPTEEMADAYFAARDDVWPKSYRAVLSAAPKPAALTQEEKP